MSDSEGFSQIVPPTARAKQELAAALSSGAAALISGGMSRDGAIFEMLTIYASFVKTFELEMLVPEKMSKGAPT